MSVSALPKAFLEIDSDVSWFRELLAEKGINVVAASVLDRDLTAAQTLAPILRGEVRLTCTDAEFLERVRAAHAVIQIVVALRRTIHVTDPSLGPFWDSFKGTDVSLMRPSPNSKRRNTVWEIFVTAIAAAIAPDAAMAEPPDLTFSFRGELWGAACKVLYSPSTDKHVAEIVDGVKQIERSPAMHGLVAVNVTNLLDHRRYWQPDASTLSAVADRFASDVGALAESLHRPDLFRRMTADKDGQPRNKTRALMLYAQAAVSGDNGATLMSTALWPNGWRDGDRGERDLVIAWNQVVHDLFPVT